MSLAVVPVRDGLDYNPCRYGQSRVVFRGPRQQVRGRFVAVLGGSEVFGRFTPDPFPTMLNGQLPVPCVNLGVQGGGLEVLLHEPEILQHAAQGGLAVLVLPGAQSVSNRFFAVHPRHNDQFLRPSMDLARLFPEVDFSAFTKTRHLLLELQTLGADRYARVVAEMQRAWTLRTRQIAGHLGGRLVAVWLPVAQDSAAPLGPDPLYVTRSMVDALRPHVKSVEEVRPSPAALSAGAKGLVFAPNEVAAAKDMPGPAIHAEIAQKLQPVLARLLTV